jgi:hypothetical protein
MNTSRYFYRSTARNLPLALAVFLALCLSLGPGAGRLSAQESTIITDEEALFGEEAPDTLAPGPAAGTGAGATATAGATAAASAADAAGGISAVPVTPSGTSATAAFLKRDQVRIGGSFTGKLGTSFTWTNPWEGNHDVTNPDESSLSPTIASTLFFDARPDEDLKFYGSVKTAWPFTSENNLQIFELFTDFTWNDAAYFRFGKHTVKWGVGYFFSPADVLNLTPIDVTDPTAQREGPISLRALVPIPGTQNNLWGYLLLPGSLPKDTNSGSGTTSTGTFKPEDLGYAGKAEFLIGNFEVGFGGFYQQDRAPRLMATATGSLGRFDLFGEAVASWGNDQTYVTNISTYSTETRDGVWYFQGTAGFLYTARDGYTSIAAQYYYNGEGYSYDERKSLVDQFYSLPQTLQDNLAPALVGALYGASQHYGALSVSRSELFIKDLSASVLVLANLADLSGFINPNIQYRVFKYMNLSISPSFVWYIDGLWGTGKHSEYVLLNKGPAVTISLNASLGSGRF